MALVFEKYKKVGLGCSVKDATMFDHSGDKIISFRLKIVSAKGKDGEAGEAIDATLFDIDIYRKDIKKTKVVGQCTNLWRRRIY